MHTPAHKQPVKPAVIFEGERTSNSSQPEWVEEEEGDRDVLAKKKGKVTMPQPAVCGKGQEGSWESRTQTICSPRTQKSSRNPDLQGGNPAPEAAKAGTS